MKEDLNMFIGRREEAKGEDNGCGSVSTWDGIQDVGSSCYLHNPMPTYPS